MAGKKAKYSARSKRIIAIMVMAVLLIGAVVLFVNRKKLSDTLPQVPAAEKAEAWSFENGARQVFAACGNSLAIASSTGFELLDSSGATVTRQIFSLGAPALTVTGERGAVWDVGGRELRLFNAKGVLTQVETEKPLIAVALNSAGFLAVCSEETGYKGMVTVYNKDLLPVFKWHSGAGYLLSADVSPDGKSMAAVTVSQQGGEIHFFYMGSEDEKGLFIAPETVIVDAVWLSDDRLCAITQTEAVFTDGSGGEKARYDFGGMYMTAYSTGGDGYVTLALSKYLSGGTDAIVSLDENGRELGRTAPSGEVKSLVSMGRWTAALYGGGAEVFNSRMQPEGEKTGLTGVRAIVVRQRGDALLIGTYTGDIWKF